jgi:putative ATP-binding cassette transporter
MQKFSGSKQFFQDVWWLTKSYWHSEEKRKATLLLAVIVALTLGVVYMLVLLNEWNNAFYSALQNYDKETIFHELYHFTWLAFVYIILAVYAFYMQQVLTINWRRWLTNRYIDEWLKNKTYYRLAMFGTGTDNPDQRISEDVRMFVEYTLKFGIGILKALTTFISFVVILYTLSGPLDFTAAGINFHIPGYMVWVALLYSVIGTWLTYKVGNKLVGLNYVQQRYEADFRFSMMRLRENAESVAFYSGEGHESGIFKSRFKLLLDNFWQIITKQKQLIWLNSGYSQIAIIFPFVVAMPRFLAKTNHFRRIDANFQCLW